MHAVHEYVHLCGNYGQNQFLTALMRKKKKKSTILQISFFSLAITYTIFDVKNPRYNEIFPLVLQLRYIEFCLKYTYLQFKVYERSTVT